MQRIGLNHRTLAGIFGVVTIILAQIVNTSVATPSPASTPILVDADLTPESTTLNGFVNDLRKFDKKSADLGRKASLTRAEFDSHERTAGDLRRRLSAVQNALSTAIRKLKAAGQWENLDQIVLAKISDSGFQGVVRREGFKKVLEEAVSSRFEADEIVTSLDALRNKVTGQTRDSSGPANSTLASRAIRVSYTPARAMATNAKCRLACLRMGITGCFSRSGESSDRSSMAQSCYCFGNQAACNALDAL
jgi:hypothetical protein